MSMDLQEQREVRSWDAPLPERSTLVLTPGQMAVDVDLTWAVTLSPPADTAAILVTSGSGRQTLERWQRTREELPASVTVIQVSDVPLSENLEFDGQPVRTTRIAPTDLTGLGMALSDLFTGIDQKERNPVVCFDLLTVLLHFNNEESVFRFLHTVTTWMEKVSATAAFYLNPSAHDSQTVNTLYPLFDDVVRVGQDGTLHTQKRSLSERSASNE